LTLIHRETALGFGAGSSYSPPRRINGGARDPLKDWIRKDDAAASSTGSGPANLATIRAAVIAALKDAGYLHIPEGRRDHTAPAETLRLHGLD
jgi:hypothetical protein